jgi:hypothetical protein
MRYTIEPPPLAPRLCPKEKAREEQDVEDAWATHFNFALAKTTKQAQGMLTPLSLFASQHNWPPLCLLYIYSIESN